MTAPYIPPRDAALDAWGANFSGLITASPATYGLTSSDATAIATAFAAFDAAYAVVSVPANRSQTTVATKNTTKATFVALARTYAQQITANPGVADSDKLALGLNLKNSSPSPIPAPTSQPLLAIKAGTPLQLELRYADANSPASRKKAPGSISVQLFLRLVALSAPPPSGPLPADMTLTATKNPVALNFSSGQAGMVCYVWGQFVNRNGLVGPLSNAVSQIVPAAA